MTTYHLLADTITGLCGETTGQRQMLLRRDTIRLARNYCGYTHREIPDVAGCLNVGYACRRDALNRDSAFQVE